jgi:pimeloyl-ACP methyl ester carboxylesterase
MLTPIVLLHGLGSHPISFLPMQLYLTLYGINNTHAISYDPDNQNIMEAVSEIDFKLTQKLDKNQEIIVIGQSMGGVIGNNLHRAGWKIKKAIYIGSPLHGARTISSVRKYIPRKILDVFESPAWNILENKDKELEPPHDYHTITMGLNGGSNYFFEGSSGPESWKLWDGKVWKDEAMFSEDKNTHLNGEEHSIIFVKPRLWRTVLSLLPTGN